MDIETACAAIIGDKLAHDIIATQGVHWAVVVAMQECTTAHGPEVKRTIDEWLKGELNLNAASN